MLIQTSYIRYALLAIQVLICSLVTYGTYQYQSKGCVDIERVSFW